MPTDVGCIFPPATDAASSDASELHSNPHTFRNYAGVEEHEATEKELQLHVDAKHLAEFDTYDELSQFVNATEAEPAVLNKIGLVIKVKHDAAGNPVEKARMILDTKESGVGALSGKHQRVMLPRLLDAVLRLLYLMSIAVLDPSKFITTFVLDYTQAFWQIPIAPEERKFFCATAKLRGKRRFLAFLRAAQGSKLAPLHWRRLIALVCCLTQSILPPEAASLLCYVDDPLAGIVGTEDEINSYVAMIILTWKALGFRLSYAKGQIGHTVTWIGGS